jgi:hypothetical protein
MIDAIIISMHCFSPVRKIVPVRMKNYVERSDVVWLSSQS